MKHNKRRKNTKAGTGSIEQLIDFDQAFKALTSNTPFKWQRRLFNRFLSGEIPSALDLPTGLGKTSIIPIWLIALIVKSEIGRTTVPRRLVYIVNRRTVVDQATVIAEQIRQKLTEPDNPSWKDHAPFLHRLRSMLLRLSSGLDEVPLAISTLRGELADNEEWKADPARPAVIIGTIDMIGSKLLFSGYGDSRYYRTHHAGLVGQDTLIVHDEAHLTPAFSEILGKVAEAQRHSQEIRPLKVLELSATTTLHNCGVFTLQSEDEQDALVQQRLNAQKRLRFHHVDKSNFIQKMVELAKKHQATSSKVLIFARSPESSLMIVNMLQRELSDDPTQRIALLTGTIRGRERDKLVQSNPVYRAFLDHDSKVPKTLYLVSTSAGEVGIDLDADHIVCDMTTLDAMVQRLGRVNRVGGEERIAIVDIVVQTEEKTHKSAGENDIDFAHATAITLGILIRLPCKDDGLYNADPQSLRELFDGLDEKEKAEAFAPTPPVQPVTDIMLDSWTMTSITGPIPGRMEVAPFLHGLVSDPPETYVAWRKEITLLNEANVDPKICGQWLDACRIETREVLHDRTDRVRKILQVLLRKHRKNDKDCNFPLILLDERGNAKGWRLSDVVEKEISLAHCTVVLPVEVGGLNPEYGMLDGQVTDHQASELDVGDSMAGKDNEGRRERWLFTKTEEGESWTRLLTGEKLLVAPADLYEQETVTLNEIGEIAKEYLERRLLLMVDAKRAAAHKPESFKAVQTIELHTKLVKDTMQNIAQALELESQLKNALIAASLYHDSGKVRPIWQKFACNSDLANPLAKSSNYLHGIALGHYRHEFGSVMMAAMDELLKSKPDRDLILHLIASHHGWARPHFDYMSSDHDFTTEENENASAEIMRRFGQLQHHYGRWGLAWLETLLRCADIAASKQSNRGTGKTSSKEVQP
ncbi:MAG: type I-U CRISPR-associated helicase/endonuclease Cas3 [Syntrophobacter sp.]